MTKTKLTKTEKKELKLKAREEKRANKLAKKNKAVKSAPVVAESESVNSIKIRF